MESTAIIGLDVGRKRIGVAVGNVELKMATPSSVIHRVSLNKDLSAVEALMEECDASVVVVGDPVRTDGKENTGNIGRKFAQKLESRGVKVVLRDERYSTQAARRLLKPTGKDKTRTGVVDAVAAQWILQGYLDALDG